MKFKSLLFSMAVAMSFQSQAQWVTDSVTMGAGYANDIYYSMSGGAQGSPVSNTNWHLGFEMIPGGPGFGGVSIIANHTQGAVKVYSLHLTGSGKFGSLLPADTMVKTLLYNSDTSWDWGAFNMNSSGSMFDYGWGQYNTTSHMVDGDSLYLMYIGSTPYKLHITHYNSTPTASIYYAFHIAKFDGTGDHLDTIRKSPNYMNKNFAYFDVINNTEVNREPDQGTWDITFTRNVEQLYAGPGPLVPYNVTTVFSNIGVSVAEVQQLSPNASVYNTLTYLTDKHVIGSDWKHQPMGPGPWPLNDSANYFIKTKNGQYYQLHFTRFDGTSTGTIVFEKRFIAFSTNVNEVNANVTAHAIIPNPANNSADIAVEAKENGTAMIYVTDITGKIVLKNDVTLNTGLNGFNINTTNYTAGTYIVTITNGDWKINEKLIVQH